MDIKFIDFTRVENEKHLGIATVCLDDKIYLRYKINPGKEGKGFFLKEATYKVDDGYLPSFIVDSNFTCQKIESIVRENLKRYFLENEF